MQINNLPTSKKKREIPVLSPEIVSVKPQKNLNDSDINIITLPGGDRIEVNSEHINSVIQIGAKIIDGIVNIATIREQGQQQVNIIRAEIEKIWAEADVESKKKEAEKADWHKRFDKKKELFFEIINKIENNSKWNDNVKIEIIKAILADNKNGE